MDPRPAAVARPRWAVGLLAALVVATTAGCGLRLDTPPPEPAAPDAVEQARQAAAVDAQQLALSAEDAAAGDPARAELLTAIAEGSAAQVEVLGGVWEAWPRGAPPGQASPSAAPEPVGDAAAVLDLLVAGSAEAREATLRAADGDLAGVLAATAVWRTGYAHELAGALDAEVQLSAGEPYPADELVRWQMDSGTALTLDAARYAYEVVAARSDGAARELAATRAHHLHDLSDAAAAALAEDPRQGVYGLPDVAAPAEVAVAAEQALLQQLVFRITLAPAEDRSMLLAAALDAAEHVRRWGGTVPPVPGAS